MTVLNVRTTLDKITVKDRLDIDLFQVFLGPIVERLMSDCGLSIYGEMAGLFAEKGDFVSALRLEELGHELSADGSCRILCGYAAASFGVAGSQEPLANICRVHTKVLTGAGLT
jgi:hypothetical protein